MWVELALCVLYVSSRATLTPAQDAKISRAQSRGRDILKFSPLVTDAYFHYTPSQIMLAALSMADHDLFERLIAAMFPHQPNGDSNAYKVEALSQAIKEKTVSTVMACKEMLNQEPPERMTNFWGTVSSYLFQSPVRIWILTCTSSPKPIPWSSHSSGSLRNVGTQTDST